MKSTKNIWISSYKIKFFVLTLCCGFFLSWWNVCLTSVLTRGWGRPAIWLLGKSWGNFKSSPSYPQHCPFNRRSLRFRDRHDVQNRSQSALYCCIESREGIHGQILNFQPKLEADEYSMIHLSEARGLSRSDFCLSTSISQRISWRLWAETLLGGPIRSLQFIVWNCRTQRRGR